MIQLWHGGRRWKDRPTVKPPTKGRYECGPGIYLTNQYDRARKYAGRNGVTTMVSLRENLVWLERKEISLQLMEDYVRQTYGFRKRDVILKDLEDSAYRLDRDQLSASYLVNLCVNHEVLSGKQGVFLADWLVEQGIDASLHVVNLVEHWVIVFNPEVIESYDVVSASKVALDKRTLPLVNLPARY